MNKGLLVLGTILAPSLSVGCREMPERFDIVIRGGTVIDGTGAEGRVTDVGISGDRITWIGPTDGAVAGDTIDAAGLVVAPGFIDVHSHTPPALATPERRFNEGVIRQGVTTVVGGPDGGFAPSQIRELTVQFEQNGVGTNVAFYVGHNAIRSEVMVREQRLPTDAEIEEMKTLVREGMELGAVGFSTGLMYEPGMFSTTGEVVALAAEAAPFDGIYDSHVRNPVHEFVASDLEAIEVGRHAGVLAKIGHLKAVGLHNEGKIAEIISLVEAARANGRAVVSDQYPYDGAATSTLTGIIVMPEEMRGDRNRDVRPPLRNRTTRAALKEASENGVNGGFAWLKATGYSSMRITNSTDYPELVGQYLSEIAEQRGIDPFDLVSELILGAETPVGITLGAIKEHDVRQLMVQPWNMIASDGAYSDGETPRGHPRSTGTFPRVLGRYVREWNGLTLEQAVHKMTGLPAETVGLADRGRLEEGLAADVTVFDPATVIDRSTWDEPHLFSVGIEHVIVNGVSVLHDGKMTGEAPGRVLRRQPLR